MYFNKHVPFYSKCNESVINKVSMIEQFTLKMKYFHS